MKKTCSLTVLAAVSASFLMASPRAAVAGNVADTQHFLGHWSAMGLSPVIVTQDTAERAPQKLAIHLPDEMKMLGKSDFVLTRKDNDTFESSPGAVRARFHLTSDNSALLSITGGSGQHSELPLTRDD